MTHLTDIEKQIKKIERRISKLDWRKAQKEVVTLEDSDNVFLIQQENFQLGYTLAALKQVKIKIDELEHSTVDIIMKERAEAKN